MIYCSRLLSPFPFPPLQNLNKQKILPAKIQKPYNKKHVRATLLFSVLDFFSHANVPKLFPVFFFWHYTSFFQKIFIIIWSYFDPVFLPIFLASHSFPMTVGPLILTEFFTNFPLCMCLNQPTGSSVSSQIKKLCEKNQNFLFSPYVSLALELNPQFSLSANALKLVTCLSMLVTLLLSFLLWEPAGRHLRTGETIILLSALGSCVK